MIVPAVKPDNPDLAKPSDHLVPVAYPISGVSGSVSRSYSTKVTRPLPESAIRSFGQWLTHEKWPEISGVDEPDAMLQKFIIKILSKLEDYFPKKTVKITNEDLPFIDWKLKSIKRRLMRLYRKEGKSQAYLALKTNYETQFQKASRNYILKNVIF